MRRYSKYLTKPNKRGGELFDFVDEKRLFIGFLSPFAPNPRPKPRIFAQNAAKSLLGGSFGKAEHDQRRERLFELFAVAGSRKSGVGVAQSGELAAQLDDDFLGGFQPQPLDVFQQHGVARSDDALAIRAANRSKGSSGRYCRRRRHADQMAEEFALGFGRETVEQLRVLAHDVMDVQTGRLGVVRWPKTFQARYGGNNLPRRHL